MSIEYGHAMTFELSVLRFEFRAVDEIYLPHGKTANTFRGALGELLRRVSCRPDCPGAKQCPHRSECAYARFFEPTLEVGPSGLADPPRPFVLRPEFPEAQHLHPGSPLVLRMHLFDVRTPFLPYLIAALTQLAQSGLGPGRGRARLERVSSTDMSGRMRAPLYSNGRMLVDSSPQPVRLSLDPVDEPVESVRIRFVTPTELKSDGQPVSRPEFGVLIARLRDRIAALDRLYGNGVVEFDWKGVADAAMGAKIVAESLRLESVERRSTRTGQVHPIGGFTGWVQYEGDLRRFLPILRVGQWTGVGRQTVWGKGAFRIEMSETTKRT